MTATVIVLGAFIAYALILWQLGGHRERPPSEDLWLGPGTEADAEDEVSGTRYLRYALLIALTTIMLGFTMCSYFGDEDSLSTPTQHRSSAATCPPTWLVS